MRDHIADSLTDPGWVVIRAEFDGGALRSERIRQCFCDAHRWQVREGRRK